jgi:hypothetical protein
MPQGQTDPHTATMAALDGELRRYKRTAERAFDQLADQDFFFRLNDRQNSIWVIIKHLAGNMHSRWTDFLTSDGEKPGRHRDNEFVEDVVPRAHIMQVWEDGWACTFNAISPLCDGDLLKTITIRGEPMTAVSAITRQIAHYASHIGQIMLIAKHIKGNDWKWLTIPPGQSEQFNRQLRDR